jgi:hypothetical protein
LSDSRFGEAIHFAGTGDEATLSCEITLSARCFIHVASLKEVALIGGLGNSYRARHRVGACRRLASGSELPAAATC